MASYLSTLQNGAVAAQWALFFSMVNTLVLAAILALNLLRNRNK